MNMVYALEGNESLPITGTRHLENHVNYLLRTDNKQKWTNELTISNEIWIDGQKEIAVFGDLKNRFYLKKLLKDNVYEDIRKRFGNMNLGFVIPNYLFQFCVFLYDADSGEFLHPQQLAEFYPEDFIRAFKVYPRVRLYALTFHKDQDNAPHMHGLFYFDSKNYRKNYDVVIDIINGGGE